MPSYSGPEGHAQDTNAERRSLLGRVRRMAVKLTTGTRWQVLGHRLLDGVIEALELETFPGIGFFARPRAGKGEAVVISVGGSDHRVVIAVRDEELRQLAAGGFAPDETGAFNSLAIVKIKADGTVEVRAIGGAAVPLATKADVQALRDYVNNQFSTASGHTHVVVAGVTTTTTTVAVPGTPPTVAAPNPAGTTVLKGQ